MKCLNCPNFVTAHAFLTGWHLFALLTVAPFLKFFYTIHSKLVKTRSSHWWCSLRKGVLRKFGKFTGKHLCQNLYFDKVAEHVWATASVKQPKTRVYFLSFSIFRQHVIVQTHRNKLNIIFITQKSKEKNTNQIYLNC